MNSDVNSGVNSGVDPGPSSEESSGATSGAQLSAAQATDTGAHDAAYDPEADPQSPFFQADEEAEGIVISEPVVPYSIEQEVEGTDEGFAQQLRHARQKRWAAVAVVSFIGLIAWSIIPRHFDHLLALTPAQNSDSPRTLFASPVASAERPTYDKLSPLFSRALPEWFEAHRVFRTSQGGPNSLTAEEALNNTRQTLENAGRFDEALSAAIQNLFSVTSGDLVAQEAEIAQSLDNLNQLCSSRRWPFRLSGRLDKEGTPTLQVRIYEKIGEENFVVGAQRTPVAYLDRLDVKRAWRDPDVTSQSDGLTAVYVRNVTTEANGTLWSALHPSPVWRLSPMTVDVAEVKTLEQTLGAQVWQEWQTVLSAEISEEAVRGLAALSRQVDSRNQLHRAINDRDPRRISIPDSPSIGGPESKLWLDMLEPYAVQGRSRLTLEDIIGLRRINEQLDVSMTAGVEGWHAVARELMVQAGLVEARRAALQKTPAPDVARRLAAYPNATDTDKSNALEVSADVGATLTWLVEAPKTCRTTLATLASRSLAANSVELTTATEVLKLLQPEGATPPKTVEVPVATSNAASSLRDAATEQALQLPGLLTPLLAQDCATLAQRAKAVYEKNFGAYEAIQRPSATLARIP